MKCCKFNKTILIVILVNIPVTSNTVMENQSENDLENSDDQAADEYELAESYQSSSNEDNLYSRIHPMLIKIKKNIRQFV